MKLECDEVNEILLIIIIIDVIMMMIIFGLEVIDILLEKLKLS